MDIVSYRGPGMAGGVSSTLARIWEDHSATGAAWWHFSGAVLQKLKADDTARVAKLPDELVKAHYRYCNEFLWPVLHDMPQYATFRPADRASYQHLTTILAEQLDRGIAEEGSAHFFLQDYQLALLPSVICINPKVSCQIFWHIPWPRKVSPEHLAHMIEIARSLLYCSTVGFHTQEYALNFMRFVEENISGFQIDFGSMTLTGTREALVILPAHLRGSGSSELVRTRVLVAPLGIDVDHWRYLAESGAELSSHPQLCVLDGKSYVLSVDRVDYTKGVTERLRAIDLLFQTHPELRGEVTFVQLSGKTRPGLSMFDAYWDQCRSEAARVRHIWGTENWQPLLWLDSPVSQEMLAALYRNARVMCVNSIREGLNLSAKEYAICQDPNKPGVLALSRGAGGYWELGEYAVPVSPNDTQQFMLALESSLVMSQAERTLRMELMQKKVKENPIDYWWQQFRDAEVASFSPAADSVEIHSTETM